MTTIFNSTLIAQAVIGHRIENSKFATIDSGLLCKGITKKTDKSGARVWANDESNFARIILHNYNESATCSKYAMIIRRFLPDVIFERSRTRW